MKNASEIIMRLALKAIIMRLTGIDYGDLTTAEKNILHIAARALGLGVKVDAEGNITTPVIK